MSSCQYYGIHDTMNEIQQCSTGSKSCCANSAISTMTVQTYFTVQELAHSQYVITVRLKVSGAVVHVHLHKSSV